MWLWDSTCANRELTEVTTMSDYYAIGWLQFMASPLRCTVAFYMELRPLWPYDDFFFSWAIKAKVWGLVLWGKPHPSGSYRHTERDRVKHTLQVFARVAVSSLLHLPNDYLCRFPWLAAKFCGSSRSGWCNAWFNLLVAPAGWCLSHQGYFRQDKVVDQRKGRMSWPPVTASAVLSLMELFMWQSPTCLVRPEG